jgi:hypothetical protein
MTTIEDLEKVFLGIENDLTLKSDYTNEIEAIDGIESDLGVLRYHCGGGENRKRINYLYDHINRLKKWIGDRTSALPGPAAQEGKGMSGLERLVAANISALKDGIAYIAVGKSATGKGYRRRWQMEILYNESASRRDFGNIRRLIGEDPKTILFNTYESAWVGISEDGSFKSIKDIATRIKGGYEAGRCCATFDDVDALMPADMRARYEAEIKELYEF